MLRNRSIEATVKAIYEAVYDSPAPMTRLEICRAIQRQKTPHLIHVIEEMVRKGWMVRTQDVFHNGVVVYLYTAAEIHKQAQSPARRDLPTDSHADGHPSTPAQVGSR
jgi:predicted transcriptional regulator